MPTLQEIQAALTQRRTVERLQEPTAEDIARVRAIRAGSAVLPIGERTKGVDIAGILTGIPGAVAGGAREFGGFLERGGRGVAETVAGGGRELGGFLERAGGGVVEAGRGVAETIAGGGRELGGFLERAGAGGVEAGRELGGFLERAGGGAGQIFGGFGAGIADFFRENWLVLVVGGVGVIVILIIVFTLLRR